MVPHMTNVSVDKLMFSHDTLPETGLNLIPWLGACLVPGLDNESHDECVDFHSLKVQVCLTHSHVNSTKFVNKKELACKNKIKFVM